MRLLVFCGTREAFAKFDRAGWLALSPEHTPGQREKTFLDFRSIPDAKMVALGRAFALGWRAPVDTAVLFDPSWPFNLSDPESIQAAARVASADAWGDNQKPQP